jgi:hypothetical protein
MAVRRGLSVERPTQVERPDDRRRSEVEVALDQALDRGVLDAARPERLDRQRDRSGDPDAIGDLDLEAVRESSRDDVLRDPPRGVGAGPIDLRRILAGEGAAAVAGHAAVAVDDDLAAGEPGVTHRAARHEPPSGIDVHDGVGLAEIGGDRWPDHRVDDLAPEPFRTNVRVVLRRDDHGPDAPGHAALVLHGDLGLAIRTQVGELAGLADLGEPARHPVGEGDRQRHQLRRLAAGEAEHHALVSGAELGTTPTVVPDLEGRVDALRDVGRLALHRDERAARLVVEAVLGLRVPDVPHGVADDGLEVDVRVCRDLAEDEDQAGRGRRLAGDPRIGVLADDRIEDRVRDLVAHLFGVALGDRLRREQVLRRVDDADHALLEARRACGAGLGCSVASDRR